MVMSPRLKKEVYQRARPASDSKFKETAGRRESDDAGM